MRRLYLTGIAVLAGSLQPVAVLAEQESAATSFTKCARIANDAQRLLCYDRLATELIELGISVRGGLGDTASAPEAAASVPAPADTAAAAAAPPAEAPAPTPAPGPVAAAPAPPTPADTPSGSGSSEDQFGIETIDEAIARDVDSIESRYVGSFDGWDGETIFNLENGQIWQQSQSGRLVYRAENPKIVIKRGLLGGYYLSVDDVNRRVRVKRIR